MAGYAQWNPATVYIVNDIVAFDGVLYISLLGSNVNRQPNSNPTYWATTGASSAITSIVAGSGISVSGTTAITVTNNGVRSISAGTNITVGGTANIPVINASPNTVRVTSVTTSVFNNAGSPIVLNNDVTTFPKTVLSITLPSAFTGCNSFTFYIREIGVQTTSTFTTGLVYFNVYLSQTFDGAINSNNGAMISRSFSAPNTTTPHSIENVIWNWAPTGGLTSNTFYFNMSSLGFTSPTSVTNVSNLTITYDVVGHFTTLT